MPGLHAKLSPSGASRWMACTPSARLEQEFPNTTSIFAEEGTFAHHVSEAMLRYRHDMISSQEYEAIMKEAEDNEHYSEALLEYCEGYVDFISEKVEEGDHLFIEERLDMSEWVPEGFGTGDAIILKPKKRKLIFGDLKYGKGVPVYADWNKQLMIYGLGALTAFEWVCDIDTVELNIYQPRLDSISTFEISVTDLKHWAETELREKARMAFEGEGVYVPGDHCGFCRAKAVCRALKDHNMKLAEMAFRDPDILDDDELLEVLEKKALFETWIKAVHDHLQQKALNGHKFEGYKLVHGRSNRRYANMEAVATALKEKGFKDIYKEPKIISITELTKKIGKKPFAEIVEPFVIKPDGRPVLVPVTDKRPEMATPEEAADVFNDEFNDIDDLL